MTVRAHNTKTDEQRAREQFDEISAFYAKHGREPRDNAEGIWEISLGIRLRVWREQNFGARFHPDDPFKLLSTQAET